MSENLYRFIGDPGSPLGQAIGGMLTTDANAIGVVIDGTNGSEITSAASVESELSAGRRLAFYKPTRTQLETLRSIAGCVPLANVGALFMRRNGNGIEMFAQPTSVSGPYTGASNALGHGPVSENPSYPYYSPDLGFLNALRSEWPQPAADPSGPPTTLPPSGAYWGMQNVGYAVPLTWPWPGAPTGYADSEWEGYGYQTSGNFSFGMNAYVYWNNGVTSNPFFTVLVSFGGNQIAPFGVDTDYCKGYSTGQLEVQGGTPVDGGGSAGPVAVQTIPPYPLQPVYTTTINVAIAGSGGKGGQQASVGFAAPTLPDEWGFTNNSSPTGFDWLWTQTGPIDFVSDPFDQFLSWWQSGFSGSWAVGPSDAGASTVPYQFIGIWQVNMPSSYKYKQGDPPPATGVAILNFPSITYSTTGYLIHSSVDCLGCYNDDDGDSEYCLWYGTPSNTQSWTLDLGQIASQNS